MTHVIRHFKENDWNSIARIYAEGIATGIATFETKVPDWKTWNDKYIKTCRVVAEVETQVEGFAVLSQASKRSVYKGVAEVSVYVSKEHQGEGIGEQLLKQLIKESETHGFWTLQAGIFSENKASIKLHEKCGFRIVGVRKKIAQLNGKWYDNQFLERRSNII